MIEINLLPHEAKAKIKKSPFKVDFLVPIILLGCALLVCVHIYLISICGIKFYQLTSLSNKWNSLLPQRKELEQLKSESEAGTAAKVSMQQLTKGQISFAPKLSKLSIGLPPGVWFTDLSLNVRELALRGSVVSLQKQELALVNKLIESLKSDKDFIEDFDALELGSVQRRVLGGYEIIDFTLNGKIKTK